MSADCCMQNPSSNRAQHESHHAMHPARQRDYHALRCHNARRSEKKSAKSGRVGLRAVRDAPARTPILGASKPAPRFGGAQHSLDKPTSAHSQHPLSRENRARHGSYRHGAGPVGPQPSLHSTAREALARQRAFHLQAAGSPDVAMSSLPPGTLLGSGRYRVIKEVNRGGTAVVYECETLPSGEHVALKVCFRTGVRRSERSSDTSEPGSRG